MQHSMLLPAVIWLSIVSYVQADNFTFSYGTASQCDNFAVSWTGGTPPFQLTLIPVYAEQQTLNIPSSSVSNGAGSFEVQLPFNDTQTMVVVMSDASGFGSGGVSNVITVGPSRDGSQCDTSAQHPDFTFGLSVSQFTECQTVVFTDYAGAVQPLTIFGMVPGGTSFMLQPPTGSTSFNWVVDAAAGTTILFTAFDSRNRTGGTSYLYAVGASNSAACLVGQSPSSVINPPSFTSAITGGAGASSLVSSTGTPGAGTVGVSRTSASSSGTGTSSSPVSSTAAAGGSPSASLTPNHAHVSTALIVGTTAGGVFGLAVLAILAFYLFRRLRRHRYDDNEYVYSVRRGAVDLVRDSSYILPVRPPSSYPDSADPDTLMAVYPTPYLYHAPAPLPGDMSPESVGSSSHVQSASGSSRIPRKSTMPGDAESRASMHIILHVDAEEVVELPPQYNARMAHSSLGVQES
ncbi:hypothetical protein B0H21DRAFT_144317 [Amylocystis lapponica]|nr:hypothetical protein B0H21DRAFT_144317 [Amylocystis lapponica]